MVSHMSYVSLQRAALATDIVARSDPRSSTGGAGKRAAGRTADLTQWASGAPRAAVAIHRRGRPAQGRAAADHARRTRQAGELGRAFLASGADGDGAGRACSARRRPGPGDPDGADPR